MSDQEEIRSGGQETRNCCVITEPKGNTEPGPSGRADGDRDGDQPWGDPSCGKRRDPLLHQQRSQEQRRSTCVGCGVIGG